MTASRTPWILAAALAAALLAGLALRPAPAEAGLAGARAAALAQAPFAGEGCAADTQGDTRQEGAEPVEDFPRADLLEVCLGAGDPFDLSVTVREVTDPATDPNWDDDSTFAAWGLDTDADGTEDYTAIFGIETDGQLEGVVVESEGVTEVCSDLTAALVDGRYRIDDVPRSCVGGAADLMVSASMFYDSDASMADAPVYTDVAPDGSTGTPSPDPSPSAGPTGGPTGGPTTGPTGGPTEGPTPGPSSGPAASTSRLFGGSRIDTAIAVSGEQFPDGAPTAYLARADVLADAVSAGSLTDGPVLLVPTCGDVPASVTAELDRLGAERVVALGGEQAVCQALLGAASAGREQGRLAGAGRIQTAIAIANSSFPAGADEAYLARADEFADAVAGGALTRGPILLVPTCGDVPGEVTAEVDRLGAGRVVALGGTAAVCEAELTAAASRSGAQPDRIAGADRFATAAAIARYQFGDGPVDSIFLARADDFADAVSGGSLTGGPVLLVPTCGDLPPIVSQTTAALDPARVVALGGTQAICDQVLDDVGTAARS